MTRPKSEGPTSSVEAALRRALAEAQALNGALIGRLERIEAFCDRTANQMAITRQRLNRNVNQQPAVGMQPW